MTLLIQAKYEDRCSECGKPCDRVKVQVMPFGYPKVRYVTSCCQAKASAVRVE
jgi:hypothetical protein